MAPLTQFVLRDGDGMSEVLRVVTPRCSSAVTVVPPSPACHAVADGTKRRKRHLPMRQQLAVGSRHRSTNACQNIPQALS